MDAKAEAEKRYPALHADDEELTYPRSALREFRRSSFEAGAAWALREFGYLLTREGWSHSPTWFAAEAHHIADGIEEESND